MYTTIKKMNDPFFNWNSHNWSKLLAVLGKKDTDEEPIHIRTIHQICGTDYTIPKFRYFDGHIPEKRKLAVAFAKTTLHIMPENVKHIFAIVERFSQGNATGEELAAALGMAEEALKPHKLENRISCKQALPIPNRDDITEEQKSAYIRLMLNCATLDSIESVIAAATGKPHAAHVHAHYAHNRLCVSRRWAGEKVKDDYDEKRDEIFNQFLDEIK